MPTHQKWHKNSWTFSYTICQTHPDHSKLGWVHLRSILKTKHKDIQQNYFYHGGYLYKVLTPELSQHTENRAKKEKKYHWVFSAKDFKINNKKT